MGPTALRIKSRFNGRILLPLQPPLLSFSNPPCSNCPELHALEFPGAAWVHIFTWKEQHILPETLPYPPTSSDSRWPQRHSSWKPPRSSCVFSCTWHFPRWLPGLTNHAILTGHPAFYLAILPSEHLSQSMPIAHILVSPLGSKLLKIMVLSILLHI